MKDMIVRLVFNGDARSMDAVLQRSERRLKNFGGVARREFDHIKQAANSLQGKLAALGVSFGAVMLIKQSAELDKSLIRIGQTAGETRVGITGLRAEFFRMSKETGQSIENLKQGFDNAVQAGLNFKEALPVTDAVNKAMAVTGATADQLTSGLTVAATAFNFDLAKPGQALLLLDKMTVAGRQGNAELENLSSIFARVGVNASRAGMGFDQTLAFIEQLSELERNPERLSTLGDSTLRLFTNFQYLKRAQAVTGVRFFGKSGERRDPFAVLNEIKKRYDALNTAQQKEAFMGAAFKGVDLDTIKGLQFLLTGNNLNDLEQKYQNVTSAAGKIKKDMPDAIKNAVDQTGRLKTEMRKAADDFIQPLNRGLSSAIAKMLDAKKDGGLELSGAQIAGGAATAAGVAYLGYRLGGPALKKLLGRLGRTGAGIAEGKAIEYATGVTPVFVTNWPGTALDSVVPGNAAPGGKSTALKRMLPYLAGAGMILGPATTAYSFAKYPFLSGAPTASGGINKFSPEQDALLEEARQFGAQHGMQGVQNDVHINIFADFENRRVAVENSDPNTRATINLNRGSWNNVLGMQ